MADKILDDSLRIAIPLTLSLILIKEAYCQETTSIPLTELCDKFLFDTT